MTRQNRLLLKAVNREVEKVYGFENLFQVLVHMERHREVIGGRQPWPPDNSETRVRARVVMAVRPDNTEAEKQIAKQQGSSHSSSVAATAAAAAAVSSSGSGMAAKDMRPVQAEPTECKHRGCWC